MWLIGEPDPPVFRWATTEVWVDGVLHHIGAIPPETQRRRWEQERGRQEVLGALILFGACLLLWTLGSLYMRAVIG